MSRRRKSQWWGFKGSGPDVTQLWLTDVYLRPVEAARRERVRRQVQRVKRRGTEVGGMSATLRRPAAWLLAASLLALSQTGVRCGDTYFPDGRTSHQVVIGR